MLVQQRRERYINPYTDIGFKKLFGTEMNKELLISSFIRFFEAWWSSSTSSICPLSNVVTTAAAPFSMCIARPTRA